MTLLFRTTPLYSTFNIKVTSLDGDGFSTAPSETPLMDIIFGLCQFPDVIVRPQLTVLSETNYSKLCFSRPFCEKIYSKSATKQQKQMITLQAVLLLALCEHSSDNGNMTEH